MNTEQIITLVSALLPIVLQHGGAIVHHVTDVIQQDPTLPYAEIAAKLDDRIMSALQNDQQVEKL